VAEFKGFRSEHKDLESESGALEVGRSCYQGERVKGMTYQEGGSGETKN
jgi:hypothetical protein